MRTDTKKPAKAAALLQSASLAGTAPVELAIAATPDIGKHEARLKRASLQSIKLIRTGDAGPREYAQSDHFCA
jgi:hypothetical protein